MKMPNCKENKSLHDTQVREIHFGNIVCGRRRPRLHLDGHTRRPRPNRERAASNGAVSDLDVHTSGNRLQIQLSQITAMSDEKRHTITWWLELLRAIIAALAGLLGGAAL